MDFGPNVICYWGFGDWRFAIYLLFFCGCFALYSLASLVETRRAVARGAKMSFSEPPRDALWNAAIALGALAERLLSNSWDVIFRTQYSYPPFEPSAWIYTSIVCALAVGACLAWRRSWPSLAHAAAEPKDPRPIQLLL